MSMEGKADEVGLARPACPGCGEPWLRWIRSENQPAHEEFRKRSVRWHRDMQVDEDAGLCIEDRGFNIDAVGVVTHPIELSLGLVVRKAAAGEA